jgi:negative regulator of flagellin synthesis FlgM
MVDPVGTKPAAVVDRRSVQVVATEAAAPAKPVTSEGAQAEEASSATQLSQAMAAQAPVDSDRVARIRKAVQDGNFPIYPSTIADRLLALKLEWNPHD